MQGKQKNTPDQVDQILAQYHVKKTARDAVDEIGDAAVKVDDALTKLAATPIPASARQAVADALKQLRVARAKVQVYVDRLPTKGNP